MLSGYDAYRIYNSIQLHFTSVNYSYTQTRSPISKFSLESYQKRADRYQYEKLGRNFPNKSSFEDFCACWFFQEKGKSWVGEADPYNCPAYTTFRAYMGAKLYFFERDLKELINIYGSLRQALLTSPSGMPGIINESYQDSSSSFLETFTLIDRALNITDVYDKRYETTPIRDVYRKVVFPVYKFKGFVTLNTTAELESIRALIREYRTD